MESFRILPAGDAAITIACEPVVDPGVNAWCVAAADACRRRLGSIARDVVIGFCTVTVYFDPLVAEAEWIEEQVTMAVRDVREAETVTGPRLDVPVCYGGSFGPDLAGVAAFAGLDETAVIARHAQRDYRVYLVGFVPGFAYLAAVDAAIAAPRRATPRTRVPPGSVGIAGFQTGIYPDATPGGWNIIGRTPVRPFDPDRREPFLFRPGDRVRFRPVTPLEFEGLVQPCRTCA